MVDNLAVEEQLQLFDACQPTDRPTTACWRPLACSAGSDHEPCPNPVVGRMGYPGAREVGEFFLCERHRQEIMARARLQGQPVQEVARENP